MKYIERYDWKRKIRRMPSAKEIKFFISIFSRFPSFFLLSKNFFNCNINQRWATVIIAVSGLLYIFLFSLTVSRVHFFLSFISSTLLCSYSISFALQKFFHFTTALSKHFNYHTTCRTYC